MSPGRKTDPRIVALQTANPLDGALAPVSAAELAALTDPPPAKDPMWFRVMERFGFPTLVAFGLAWGFAKYHGQVREDQAKARVEFREVVKDLTSRQAESDKEVRTQLTKQTHLLEQIREDLRSGRGSAGNERRR